MVKLNYTIVGVPGVSGDVLSIDIDTTELVGDLKNEIKKKKNLVRIKCDADKLELFLAKTEDGKWLPLDQTKNVAVSNMKKLRGSWKLNKEELFGPNVSLGKDVVHVLVRMPKPPYRPQIFPPLRSNAGGLNLENPHLPRAQLVQKLYSNISDTNFVLVLSPPGSGKTSLLTLFARQHPEFSYIPLSFLDTETDATSLLSMQGIDLVERKCWLPDDKTWIFLLDDCQQKYRDVEFWDRLLKDNSWIPKHVRFVISATSLLKEVFPSPVVLNNIIHKFTREDLLISDTEAHEYLRMENGLTTMFLPFPTVLEMIVHQCSGHIRALYASIDVLYTHFSKWSNPSEPGVLVYLMSREFVALLPFGAAHMELSKPNQAFLIECLVSDLNREVLLAQNLTQSGLGCYTNLERAGIVTEVGGYVKFTSPLVQRYYYFKLLFPNWGQEKPTPLHELTERSTSFFN